MHPLQCRRRRFFHALLLSAGLATTAILSSCATMFGDNGRALTILSQPPGASVFFGDHYLGKTPTTVTLPTYLYGVDYLTLKKPGYQKTALGIPKKFQPVGFLNILFTPGFLVDLATGDALRLSQTSLQAQLTRK